MSANEKQPYRLYLNEDLARGFATIPAVPGIQEAGGLPIA